MEYGGYIYMITNKNNTTIYTGVTSNLVDRIYEHKNSIYNGFSNRYNLNKLVYFESFNRIEEAIAREKQLKGGSRADKIILIDEFNPRWDDLYEVLEE